MKKKDYKLQSPNVKSVNCPSCQTEVIWNESSKFRPFCSQRCKLMDFGDWAMEKLVIPGESVNLDLLDDEQQ